MSNIEERLKETEREMLKATVKACETLGIKYYVIGGTLLGAARHKGFIPWDDDIDIGIMRKDYEIFKEKGQALLPEYYFLQCKESEPEYPMNFIKIRDSRTTFIESSVKRLNINHGVYIDVFPLDDYPAGKIAGAWLEFRKRIIHFRVRLVYSKRKKNSALKEWVANAISNMTKVVYPTISSAQRAWERMCGRERKTSLVANNTGAWGKREIVNKEWFGEGEELEFEGLKVRGPKEYDKWLTHVYGDWRKLPPEEQRVTHHYSEVIDTEKPYGEYRKTKGEN